ncbi:MAG: VacJ family lipoprotein, partial [Verrucomicrobiaceae bacterium]|nr:VacJ family lipoprotein [Verrucomicrobiaceae bacterium]
MKSSPLLSLTLVLAAASVLSSCSIMKSRPVAATDLAATNDKPLKPDGATDALDDYSTVEVGDPLEGFNRATFKMNDVLYTVFFRPVSKGYEFIFP